MAGLGRKVWTAGEVATAANVQGYLQDQTTMKYANTSAASSALGTAISEGMQFYLSDTDEQVFYNGSAFAKQNGTTNAIINGAFEVNQRNASSYNNGVGSSSAAYGYDRWQFWRPTYGTVSATISRQSSGLDGFQYAVKMQRNASDTSTTDLALAQSLESKESIPFVGKLVTLSFYAKKGANFSGSVLNASIISGTGTDQNLWSTFSGQTGIGTSAITLTTTLTRYTVTTTAAVANTVTQLGIQFNYTPTGTAGADDSFWVTGVQLEPGSVATPFKRNAPSIQAELAACQRYYWQAGGIDAYQYVGTGSANSSTVAYVLVNMPITMRVKPTALFTNLLALYDGVNLYAGTAAVIGAGNGPVQVAITVASGLTQFRNYFLITNNSTSAYIGFSAEL